MLPGEARPDDASAGLRRRRVFTAWLKPGDRNRASHIIKAGNPYLDRDVVFAVRAWRIGKYVRHDAGTVPGGILAIGPPCPFRHDFKLVRVARDRHDAHSRMIDKVFASAAAALHDAPGGATVMIAAFGTAGLPEVLIDALIEQGACRLTVVSNNAGNGETGLAALPAVL